MSAIVTLTVNPTVDQSTSVDRVVAEEKLRCESPRREPGGGGINVARVVRELGGDPLALWTCGGPIGQLLAECLDREKLPHRAIPITGMTRENLIVLEESTGLQYRFGFPGPELSDVELARCLDTVRALDPPASLLVLSGSLPPGGDPNFYARAAEQAPRDTLIVVDTSGEPLRRSVRGRVDVLKPNLRELGQLVDRELESDADIEAAARELTRGDGARMIVVSLGAGGAILATPEGTERLRSPTVPIRSKVGAGDSMVAGIAVALARGSSPRDAARLGVAAGAAAVMTDGTQLARRADVERLYPCV